MVFKKVKRLIKGTYWNLNRIDVSESRLRENYRILSSLHSGVAVAPILKSNAYGHGIRIAGRVLERMNPPFFCVDSLYEGYELLKAGIKKEILIMGYTNPANFVRKRLPFSYAVYDKETLRVIHEHQSGASVHLFVDTGMRREGIPLEEFEDFAVYASTLSGVRIDGLMSHLGYAGNPEHPTTKMQIRNFNAAREILGKLNIKPKWIHFSNTGGFFHWDELGGNLGNIARIGMAMYGICEEGDCGGVMPVLDFFTTLSQIKTLKKGEYIGYDFTFQAEKDMKIGILPAGYNEGIDRRLSNKGVVTIRGVRCPIVGKISMNITAIDITDVQNPKIGEDVCVFSSDPFAENSVMNIANLCGVAPYEILVRIYPFTKRKLVDNGEFDKNEENVNTQNIKQ